MKKKTTEFLNGGTRQQLSKVNISSITIENSDHEIDSCWRPWFLVR